MSSDLFVFDGSSSLLYQNSSPEEILSPETEFFFGDHDFSPFSDSAIDIFQALSDHNPATTATPPPNPLTEPQVTTVSPPSQQFQSLNLSQHPAPGFPNGFGDDSPAVKTEECHVAFDASSSAAAAAFYGGGAENAARLIQRSLSGNSSLEQKPCSYSSSSSGFLFSPRFDALVESQAFQTQALCSSENGFLRKVYSTGDLQSFGMVRTTQRSLSSPLAAESSLMEEANFKVGKYSAEERRERISKYRAKRTLRNFNKTIKYACRKTLADNRPRIRGRFARNDEPGGFDIPNAPCSSSSRAPNVDDDDNDLWLEGLHEEEGIDQTVRGQFVNNNNNINNNSYGPTQFQYYGF